VKYTRFDRHRTASDRRRTAVCRRLVAGITALTLTAAARALEPATPFEFEAVYDVEISGFSVARMERRLERTDDGYRLVSVSQASGLARLFTDDRLEETSTLVADGERLRVARYDYHRTGKKERRRRVEFPRDGDVVTGVRDGRAWEVRLDPPERRVFDRHAYQLFISLEVAEGARDLTYPIADNGRLKAYDFHTVGTERRRVAGREIETIKLVRDVEPPESTEIWVAEAYGYLPVRVELVDGDGQKTVFELESFEGRPSI